MEGAKRRGRPRGWVIYHPLFQFAAYSSSFVRLDLFIPRLRTHVPQSKFDACICSPSSPFRRPFWVFIFRLLQILSYFGVPYNGSASERITLKENTVTDDYVWLGVATSVLCNFLLSNCSR